MHILPTLQSALLWVDLKNKTPLTFQIHLQFDIKIEFIFMSEVREGFRVLREVVRDVGSQCFDGDDPGWYAGAQVLGCEGTQGDVLPFLDVASWKRMNMEENGFMWYRVFSECSNSIGKHVVPTIGNLRVSINHFEFWKIMMDTYIFFY